MWSTVGNLFRKVLSVGGWAPLAVVLVHLIVTSVFHVHRYWPGVDIPMHFMGGLAMACFLSGAYRALPRDGVRSSRIVLLELILVGALTTTAAVLWEFAEFAQDRLFGTDLHISYPNTMQDLAMGMAGAIVFLLLRARELRAGRAELREVAGDWMTGRAA